jgi:peptidoglycan/xylan/chitin deacetylase (PgdA/CDA1 family)
MQRAEAMLRVLAYHAIDDLSDDPYLRDYPVPAALLERQLEALANAGFRFIGVDEFLAHLAGRPVKGRAILLTFDDGYASLLDQAAPLLKRLDIPATVFVVTGHLGGSNDWDARRGATRLPLLPDQV